MSPSSALSSSDSVSAPSEEQIEDVQSWFVDNFLDGETQLVGGPRSALMALGGRYQVCGSLPSLVTRSSAVAPNGACPELFTAVNASCTCLSGYDNVTAWEFRVRSKVGDGEETYPLTQTAAEVLEINAVQTLYVPATLQKLSIHGVGDGPIPLTFVGEYRSGAGNELPVAKTLGETSSLTTVELVNIDMYSVVTSVSSFLPSTTTSLTMRGCNITRFGFEFTKGLTNVTHVDLSANNMASVYAGTPIQNLADKCSISLCGLEEYNLSYNKLSTFPTTALNVDTLEKFYILGNEITDFNVSKTVFDKIRNLTAFSSDLPNSSAECFRGRWETAHSSKFCVTPGDDDIPSKPSSALVHVLMAMCVVVALLAVVMAWNRLASRSSRKSEHESDLSSFSTGRHLYSIFTDHHSAIDAHQTMRVQLLSDPIIITNRLDLAEVKIGQCISRGGFGLVFSGSYHGQKVAVKKIRESTESEGSLIAQFIREITLMAVLHHDRIVQFIGVAWEAMIDLSAVTELMERGDLIAVLHSCKRHAYRLSWSDHKTVIALHIAEGLEYLHSLSPKVIHRDLKAKNVLLNTDMEAKLSDFGIARERHWDETHMTAGMGTSFWIAPEGLRGQDYDEKADVFSFGVVLSEIDTEDYPYWNAQHPPQGKVQEGEILQQVARGEKRPAFSAGCPSAVLALAQRCLQQSPRARPTAHELVNELEELVQDLVEDD